LPRSIVTNHSAADLRDVEDVVLSLQKDVIQRRQVVVTLPQIIEYVGHRVVVVDGSSPYYHNVVTHLQHNEFITTTCLFAGLLTRPSAVEAKAEATEREAEAEAEDYEQSKSNKFNCAKSPPTKNKFVSSANIIGLTFVRPDTLTRSLLYKRNRSGPRTNPRGTPQAIHY